MAADKPASPKIGDPVYIPGAIHLHRGIDDFRGGLTCIKEVLPLHNGLWITTEFNPLTQYAWTALLSKQAELAKKFGSDSPQATPDYRPEFNESPSDWPVSDGGSEGGLMKPRPTPSG